MRMTGAEMVVKTLEKNGVKVVFGYPGAANCPIIDKLSFSSIKHILTRNEQGAAHMASGYETGRCLYRNFRSGCYKPYNRYRNRIYGFYSDGCTYRSGCYKANR